MLPPKLLIRFGALVVVFYSLLMIPWPGLERGYAGLFRAGGDALFSRFWFRPQGKVHFLDLHSPTLFDDLDAVTPGKLPRGVKLPEPEGVKDTLLVLMNGDTPADFGIYSTSSRPIGFWPTALFASLMLATPLRWPRKLLGLVLGLVAVHAFIVLRLTIMLLKNGFADPVKKYHLFNPSPFWQDMWRRLDEVFADNPTFAYVAPMFFWLVVVVGLFGWSAWRSKPAALEGEAAKSHFKTVDKSGG